MQWLDAIPVNRIFILTSIGEGPDISAKALFVI
jgi:hypothetical protein